MYGFASTLPNTEASAQVGTAPAINLFVHSGQAYFTLVSKATGTRYTYRVSRPKGDPTCPLFVSLLTGSDNESSYSYFGFIRNREFVFGGAKSRLELTAPGVVAFRWFYQQLSRTDGATMLSKMEFWHEGRCCKCGRKLTVPESIAAGIGPECASHA